MNCIKGDIFSYSRIKGNAICIPTNGIINSSRDAVMGAGLAKVMKEKYAGCQTVLGVLLEKRGNIVQEFWNDSTVYLAFPTKENWKDNSSLDLIEQSCIQLVDLQEKKQYEKIILPKVGCGFGGLQFEIVEPILDKYFFGEVFLIVDLN